MYTLEYIISKILKKIRFSSIFKSKIHKKSKVESGSLIVNSFFDKYSYCGYDCEIINTSISSFCSISNNVKIGGENHPINWVSTSPVFYKGRDSINYKFSNFDRIDQQTTLIKSDVWIGANVLIKQGITIEVGSIVGMGSVVTKNVEPYSIVAGNPAVLIKKRFDDNTITRLLTSKWWEMSDSELKKFAIYFNSPDLFLKEINL
jgi:acetyltransferase-like isoleucine patch superfamily enzyme